MKKFRLALIFLVGFSLNALSQNTNNGYNSYENNTLNYISNLSDKNDINWSEIIKTFESYFKNIDLVVDSKRDTSFYFKILDHLQHGGGTSETGQLIDKQSAELIGKLNKQGLTRDISKNCLYEYLKNYETNKKVETVPWSFHVIGTCISKYKEFNEEVHPAFVIAAIKEMKPADYKKDLYKRSIILLIYYMYSK